jgi:DNA invertase Pin-like site-specific DNA recombinase
MSIGLIQRDHSRDVMFLMFATLAKQEPAKISDRTKAGLRVAKAGSTRSRRLRVIPCPPKYECPREGDRVKLELRLESGSDRRRSWQTYIIRFPGDGLDRGDIHEITDYDS